jgi:hypothetical protein
MPSDPKKTKWRSKKWRDAAKGQPCTMRLEGCCDGGGETTVLAHRNGGGMGTKASDHDAADMCFNCHHFFDNFNGRINGGKALMSWMNAEFDRARLETIINRLERGIVS